MSDPETTEDAIERILAELRALPQVKDVTVLHHPSAIPEIVAPYEGVVVTLDGPDPKPGDLPPIRVFQFGGRTLLEAAELALRSKTVQEWKP